MHACQKTPSIRQKGHQQIGKGSYPKSDRGLISNIYKGLKKMDSRKSNNPIKKWGTELNKEFSTKEYRMAVMSINSVTVQILFKQPCY
jgi:hypothetical protein